MKSKIQPQTGTTRVWVHPGLFSSDFDCACAHLHISVSMFVSLHVFPGREVWYRQTAKTRREYEGEQLGRAAVLCFTVTVLSDMKMADDLCTAGAWLGVNWGPSSIFIFIWLYTWLISKTAHGRYSSCLQLWRQLHLVFFIFCIH